MITAKRKLGDFGEFLAVEYLRRHGYQIIEKNFQTKDGEVDIIAEGDGCRHIFIEVKTRAKKTFGLPEESVDYRKKEKILKTIYNYFFVKDIRDDNWRLDIISILADFKKRSAKISHFKAIRFW